MCYWDYLVKCEKWKDKNLSCNSSIKTVEDKRESVIRKPIDKNYFQSKDCGDWSEDQS